MSATIHHDAGRPRRSKAGRQSVSESLTASIIIPAPALAVNTRPTGLTETMSRKSKSLLLGAIVITAVLAYRRLRTPSNDAAAESAIEKSTENRPSGA